MAKELSQWERRKQRKLTDQHGRIWDATFDIVSDGPCSPINPWGWSAPLVVPQKYVKLNRDDTTQIEIQYDAWLADLREAHKQYQQNLMTNAMMIYADKGPAMVKERDPFLLSFTGPAPQPIEPVLAAKQGNPWVLGFTDTPDPRLEHFFVVTQEPEPDYSTLPDYSEPAESDDVAPKRRGRPPKALSEAGA